MESAALVVLASAATPTFTGVSKPTTKSHEQHYFEADVILAAVSF